jgi:hypothetical protein
MSEPFGVTLEPQGARTSMKYEQATRYLARMWLAVPPLRLDEETYKNVHLLLGEQGLVPGMATDGGTQRPVLINPIDGFHVVLAGESFDFARIPVTATPVIGQLDDFVGRVVPMMAALARSYNQAAFRLALVQEGFLHTEGLEKVPKRLMNVPAGFPSNQLTEWDWRIGTHVPAANLVSPEKANALATIKRFKGTLVSEGKSGSFDKVQLTLDFNTVQDDLRPRFTHDQIGAFFDAAQAWHGQIWEGLSSLLGEAV